MRVLGCAAVVFQLSAATGQAETLDPYADLLAFMGGHGCTFADQSQGAALAAGFSQNSIIGLSNDALDAGVARQEGDYVVFDQSICTIRLPDIQSNLSASDPFIRSITTSYDHYDKLFKDDPLYEGEDVQGCFLVDPSVAFDKRAGGVRGSGFDDYIAFLAAGLISGEVRFYSPSALSTPISTQVMVGPGCDSVPNAAFVKASHPYLLSDFGTYIRMMGELTSCTDNSAYVSPAAISAQIQNADRSLNAPEDPYVNAWLFFEWDLITFAAGWHEGMSGTERGTPRPPLCHYPQQ